MTLQTKDNSHSELQPVYNHIDSVKHIGQLQVELPRVRGDLVVGDSILGHRS